MMGPMADDGKKATVKKATVHHISGKRFVGKTPDHQQVMIDGEDYAKTGMNPMELLLNAVGACAAFDVVEMIRKRRVDLIRYDIELEGDRADGVPAFYTDIRAHHIIDAPGLSQEMAERFVDLAMNKYCSVASSLNSSVSFTVTMVDSSAEREAEAAP